MKKEIRGLISEIIFVSILIVVMIPLFSNLVNSNLKTTESMLATSSKLTISEEKADNGLLFPMTDEYAKDNLKDSIITINNTQDQTQSYNLIFRVAKDSSITCDLIKIKVNDKISYLTENNSYEDDNYYYFIIYTSSVKKSEEVAVSFWMKEEVTKLNGGNFSYSFAIDEDSTLAYN